MNGLKKIGTNFYIEEIKGKKPIKYIANEKILEQIEEGVYRQARNVILTPGVDDVVITPDAHHGYFCPIGCVAASKTIISPGAVGVDIGCGMRLILTNLNVHDLRTNGEINRAQVRALMDGILHDIPLGEKVRSFDTKTQSELFDIFRGRRSSDDPEIREHRPFRISKDIPVMEHLSGDVIKRAMKSVGSLGGGNHFIEIQVVEEIHTDIAEKWGLRKDQIVAMVHSGSRNLGYQIADYWVTTTRKKFDRLGITYLDRDGMYMGVDTPEGQHYIAEMRSALNFAVENRAVMAKYVMQNIEKVFPGVKMSLLYDVCHNNAMLEEHFGERFWVHRKGATRALPPRHPLLKGSRWFNTGHPVILPGSMGTASYIMVGVDSEGNRLSYSSINHGAGRVMSRKRATKIITQEQFERALGNVLMNARNYRSVVDECSLAYKDIDEIIDSVVVAGLAQVVAKLKPIGVIKDDTSHRAPGWRRRKKKR
ncbi:RtcB family protein [candidate division KSB1 bacterium]|nr:RtcB family protein [candidate division KSB1 bacterium]